MIVGAAAAPAPDEPPLARVEYTSPVAAPVVEPFRPPAHPFGPGNRGVDYGTVPGQAVVAAAPGVVVFAGTVAGARHVTLQHADRLRTTYAFLATVAVDSGQVVARGDPLGTAAGRLHLSARLGDAYLDPAVLLDASAPAGVRLVPDDP